MKNQQEKGEKERLKTGYIKLWRSIKDHPIFDNEKLFKIFMWCLLKARYIDGEIMIGRKKIFLRRGQFVFGRKAAAEELNMSPSTVWFYMKMLNSDRSFDRCIDISSKSRFSIITVINWAFWQGELTDKLTDTLTIKSAEKDTNKNVKNVKNVKNE